jgi:hypothetical protein
MPSKSTTATASEIVLKRNCSWTCHSQQTCWWLMQDNFRPSCSF